MKRLSALICVLALLAACGGDDGDGGDPSPAPSVPLAEATDIRGLATQTAAEETVVATTYPLKMYLHEAAARREGSDIIDFSYEFLAPEGWVVEAAGVTSTVSLPGENDFPYVTISIDCRPGVDKTAMLSIDSETAGQVGIGNLGNSPRQDGTVGEREAILVEWAGTGAFPAQHLSAYVDGEDCAWRLQLNTLGAIRISDFEPLFREVLARFDPSQGLPEGFVPAR